MTEYGDIEKMLRDVDFTKGSDHRERLRNRLFRTDGTDCDPEELGLDEMSSVRAAVKKDEGFDPVKKHL